MLSSSRRSIALTFLLRSSIDCSKDACRDSHSDSFLAAASLSARLLSFSWLFSCSRRWIWLLEARTCLLSALHCWYSLSPSSSITSNFPLPSSIQRVSSFFSSRQWRWLSSASLMTVLRWAITCPSLQSAQWEACCLPAALNRRTYSFKLPIWSVRFSISSLSFHSRSEKNSSCLASFSSYCLVSDSTRSDCSSFRSCIWYQLSRSASEPRMDFRQQRLRRAGKLHFSSMDSLVLSLRY